MEHFKKIHFIALLICLAIFIFFSHTLNYTWKTYDEHIVYDETIFPIPNSFFEIFEIIKNFGLKHYFESTNPLYSNISNIRGTPIDVLYSLFLFYFFKKSAFTYHLFSLTLHIINSLLCFLILNKISSRFNIQSKLNVLIVSLLTLLWSLHPVQIESILLATNSGALVTYSICFVIFYYYLKSIYDDKKINSILIFFIYLFSLFLNEYAVTLPIIIFLYSFCTHFQKNDLNHSILLSLKATTPLISGLFLFSIYFFCKETINVNQENVIEVFQRIIWLSPQIFVHYLKLIFYPVDLSLDQTAFVKISNSFSEVYGLSCSIVTYLLVFLSFISIFVIRRSSFYFASVLFLIFFISFLPFLHIFSPLYNLASERYVYFPLFFLVFSLVHILFNIISRFKSHFLKYSLLIAMCVVLCLFNFRSYTRTLDWKDSFSLLSSCIEVAPNNLYRGLREYMLGKLIIDTSGNVKLKNEYLLKSLTSFNQALIELKLKKKKHQRNISSVVKFYGLDPKTLIAKTYFLISLVEMDLKGDVQKAYNILSPHIKDISMQEDLIVDFYYKLLFNTQKYDAAEKFLKKAIAQNKFRPLLLVAYSDFIEFRYKKIKLTEKYLLESFKYFPYNEATLFGLRRLYRALNKSKEFANFSYLYGLRTHDITSLKEACLVYIGLNNKQKARSILRKLSKDYPNDKQILFVKSHYESVFGGI